ncbi:hypothetical protein ACFZBE_40460 [Streptomyces sp. NPDC008061]|uniref:hypothetical protein n=1 Tax=Streptomyces sp. NPDC008061 TaxID=3364805 RepID=UPI0036EAED13
MPGRDLGPVARSLVPPRLGPSGQRRQRISLGLGYAVGIPASYQVTDGAGHRWDARKLINKVRPGQWMRRQTGHGTKGTREYDWAWLDIRPDDTPDENEKVAGAGAGVLVARRHRYTGEVSFFPCWAPGAVSLATLVEVICRRWRIEEAFQFTKGFTGLDQGQVTCWNSWMRWSLFSLIAAALALTAAVHEDSEPQPGLIPLNCPELIRLLRVLVLPPPARDRDHALHWIAPSPSCRDRLSLATTPPSRPAMVSEAPRSLRTAVLIGSRSPTT